MKKSDQIHVVLVPWSASGHLMPFFQLSIALVKSGVHVSLFSTPKNIQRLPEIPPEIQTLFDLVAPPLPAMDSGLLPEGAEATVDIPFDRIQYLKQAADLLKDPFKDFIADQSPDWIISDILTYWAAETGLELNVPVIAFYPFSAATAVFFGPPEYLIGEGRKAVRPSAESLMKKPPWVGFESKVAYKKYEAIRVHAGFYRADVTGVSTAERMAKVVLASKAVAIRSCLEFEPEYFSLQERISGKPAIPIGFLPPEKPTLTNASTYQDDARNKIFQWLDRQKPKSAVFVGFGSECKLRKDQIHEIALGLELSQVAFLWVLQKPIWANTGDLNESDALPAGFSNRVDKKRLINIGWAPQREILAHPSIGSCLFHAGWGSVIETLQHGHSLVVLPFIVDQGLNSRYLVEKGLAIEVDRLEDGSFTKEDIVDSLRRATAIEGGGESAMLRARASEAAAVFGDEKLNERCIEALVKYMHNGLRK